jgi:hypothetical protein
MRGRDIEIDDAKLEAAREAVVTLCEGLRARKFSVSWAYDQPVTECLASHLPEDKEERYAFLWALEKVLKAGANYRDWHDGHEAAARTVGCKLAWSTPGFAEARRFSDEFGS